MSRLEEIRERVRRTTRGPWLSVVSSIDDRFARVLNTQADHVADLVHVTDAPFISQSRADVEYLLDLVDSLAKQIDVADRRERQNCRRDRR